MDEGQFRNGFEVENMAFAFNTAFDEMLGSARVRLGGPPI